MSSVPSGCVTDQPALTSTIAPVPHEVGGTVGRLPAHASSGSTANGLQNELIGGLIEEDGQTACDVPTQKPATDVDELVDLVLATYGVENGCRCVVRLVGQGMRDSAAAHYPEQG